MNYKVILANPDVKGGAPIHSIEGRSSKVYGKTFYDPSYNAHIFEMSMEQYRECAIDILSNKRALQTWVPFFVPSQEQAIKESNNAVEDFKDDLADIAMLLEEHASPEDNMPSDTLKRLLSKLPKEAFEKSQPDKVDYHSMKKDELINLAKERNVEAPEGLTKFALAELLSQ